MKNANDNNNYVILNSNNSCWMEQSTFQNDNAKLGFTLAEVLITLGIIGIVAAMTMPTLIQNHKNRQLESGLRTAYSTIQNGLSRMNTDKDKISVPADFLGTSGIFYNEYKNYFNKIYDCGWSEPDETICMSRANDHGSGDGVFDDNTYKTFNGGRIDTTLFDDGQFVLSNGMLVMIENPYWVKKYTFP